MVVGIYMCNKGVIEISHLARFALTGHMTDCDSNGTSCARVIAQTYLNIRT